LWGIGTIKKNNIFVRKINTFVKNFKITNNEKDNNHLPYGAACL
jgi:hypothetical protein